METKNFPSQPIKTAADLGEAIRSIRRASKLTQDAVASLSGLSTGFLSDFENGKPTAEIGKVLKVLRTLGVDLHLVRRTIDTGFREGKKST